MPPPLSEIDFSPIVLKSIKGVFEMMLGMAVDPVAVPPNSENGERIAGTVSFAGEATGVVCLSICNQFAKTITNTMLGTEVVEVDDQVRDVLGEVTNMVAGNLKSHLTDLKYSCVLSIPSITSGSFSMGSSSGTKKVQYSYHVAIHEQLILVTVYLKTG